MRTLNNAQAIAVLLAMYAAGFIAGHRTGRRP